MNTTGMSIASGMGYPAYLNAILKEYPNFTEPTPSSKRLFWTLNGPLESAIQVMATPYYEPGDVLEPYFRSAEGGDLALSSWNSVSLDSLMQPPVATVTVRVRCLDSWEELWVELNRYCTNTETDPRRPRAHDVQLEVTPAHGGAFLTVHDYVSAVHPWLMSMRERILHALGENHGQPAWPPETKLAVLHFGRGPISIDTEDRWAEWKKKPPPWNGRELTRDEREEADRKVKERALARSAARIRELERLRQEEENRAV